MITALYSSATKAINNSGIAFIIRFLVLYALFYYINIAVIAFSTPDGMYISFVDKYLDYITVWRKALLNTAAIILQVFGTVTEMPSQYKMKLAGSTHTVTMVYSCIGYGVTSVWLAFTVAMKMSLKSKIAWGLLGAIGLFFLNSLRILAILMAHGKWQESNFISHHTLFNIVAYGFVFLLMYLIIRKNDRTA